MNVSLCINEVLSKIQRTKRVTSIGERLEQAKRQPPEHTRAYLSPQIKYNKMTERETTTYVILILMRDDILSPLYSFTNRIYDKKPHQSQN